MKYEEFHTVRDDKMRSHQQIRIRYMLHFLFCYHFGIVKQIWICLMKNHLTRRKFNRRMNRKFRKRSNNWKIDVDFPTIFLIKSKRVNLFQFKWNLLFRNVSGWQYYRSIGCTLLIIKMILIFIESIRLPYNIRFLIATECRIYDWSRFVHV